MWSLVLSGGAAYGIANVGVVDVLERHDCRPDSIAGSSMGAIVGALYATGHSAKAMCVLCESLRLSSVAIVSQKPLRGGLHGGLLTQNLRLHLEPLLGQKRIADCTIPFVCIAGRVLQPIEWHRVLQPGFTAYVRERVERYIFPPETPLIDALLASSAIPVLFSPHRIGNDEFVDLMSFGAVPAKTTRELHNPDILIATDTNPRYEKIQRFLPPHWRQFVQDGLDAMDESLGAADLVIRPEVRGNPMRFDRAMEMVEAGRRAAEAKLSAIRALMGT